MMHMTFTKNLSMKWDMESMCIFTELFLHLSGASSIRCYACMAYVIQGVRM